MHTSNEIVSHLIRTVTGLPGAAATTSITLSDATLKPTESTYIYAETTRHLHVHSRYDTRIEEDLDFSWDMTSQSLHCERRCRNSTTEPLALVELGFHLQQIALPGDRQEDYFYHTENPRIYGCFTIPIRLKRSTLVATETEFDVMGGSKWADPGTVTDRIGASVYQPFPALLVSNYQAPDGWVHGSLSQDIFYHNYLVEPVDGSVRWDIFSSCKAVSTRCWQPGETLHDHWYLGKTTHAADFNRIFENYTASLRQVLPANQGATDANRRHLIWGSWNDGIGQRIDEEHILKIAGYLSANLPTVRWLQIDDGYAARAKTTRFAHGLGVPYETDGIDTTKFPHGMRHVSNAIRERGLRPAIWVGGLIPNNSPLGHDHPEWMCDYSYRLTMCKPLDISIPAVREYMLWAMRRFLADWGYQSVKFDFWSYVFEDSHPLLSGTEKTGYEWRRWFLHQVREMIPRDSYAQGGCDICMGNPFLGEWFNNYRYGIDIGSGNWDHVKTSMQWGAACFATHTGDLFVPNSDAIGILPKLSDEAALTTINYCLISRSLVEVSGWLHETPDHPRLAWVKKAICCPNNGQDVYFSQFNYRAPKATIPQVWFIKTPHFSRLENAPALPSRTVAIFNTQETEATVSLHAESLDLPAGDYIATDVWSLKTQPLTELQQIPLPSTHSRLFALSKVTGRPQILDANIAIRHTCETASLLEVEFEHPGDLTLVLTHKPSIIKDVSGTPLESTLTEGMGNMILRTTLSTPDTRLAIMFD